MRDINNVTDSNGKKIEEGIKCLVQALWNKGYNTEASCEGHSDRGRGYPWVDFAENLNELDRLHRLIDNYNHTKVQNLTTAMWQLKERNWITKLNCPAYELKPVNGISLEDTKRDTKNLAQFINDTLEKEYKNPKIKIYFRKFRKKLRYTR